MFPIEPDGHQRVLHQARAVRNACRVPTAALDFHRIKVAAAQGGWPARLDPKRTRALEPILLLLSLQSAMELRHLRYLVAVSHTGSFTRAAEAIHVTQSTLSHQIAQLESELGVRLFAREGRSVRLTPDGEAFLARAQKALAILDEGIRVLRPDIEEGRVVLRLGTTPSLASRLVTHAAARLLKTAEVAKVVITEGGPNELCDLLRREEVDLVLAYPPVDGTGLTCQGVLDEEVLLVVGRDHPFAKRRRVRLVDLHNMPLILPTHHFSMRDLIDGFFAQAGTNPRVLAEVDSVPGTLELVAQLGAAALLPASVLLADDRWKSVPIERPFARRMVSVFRKAGQPPSAAIVSTIAALQAVAGEISAGASLVRTRKTGASM